jgi:hypothetical protein
MMARTRRDASQFHARIGGMLYLLIGELSFAVWLTVKGVNVA